jgi:hypothetical protein
VFDGEQNKESINDGNYKYIFFWTDNGPGELINPLGLVWILFGGWGAIAPPHECQRLKAAFFFFVVS